MIDIKNLVKLSKKYIDDPNFETNLRTKYLGAAAGSKKLYVNIDYIKPGGISTKFHSHSHQEEFFAILKGTGLLRTNNKKVKIHTNDFFAKPSGKGIAHQFINDSNDILIILDCGVTNEDDEIYYPDEKVTYKKKIKKAFKDGKPMKNWSSDPNE